MGLHTVGAVSKLAQKIGKVQLYTNGETIQESTEYTNLKTNIKNKKTKHKNNIKKHKSSN